MLGWAGLGWTDWVPVLRTLTPIKATIVGTIAPGKADTIP
jgi:hypothetical protein